MERFLRFLQKYGLVLALLLAAAAVYGGIKGPQVIAWIGGAGCLLTLLVRKLTSNGGEIEPVKFT